jgi:hypothetical protein
LRPHLARLLLVAQWHAFTIGGKYSPAMIFHEDKKAGGSSAGLEENPGGSDHA